MRILFFLQNKEESAVVNELLTILGKEYDCVAEAEIALVFKNPETGDVPSVKENANGNPRGVAMPELFTNARPQWLEMV